MQFNYTNSERPTYPATDKSFFTKKPRSLTYHEFIDLVKFLWEKGHPDIEFVPMNGGGIADIQKGYIVYALESRTPTKDFPKPRVRETIKDTESGEDIEVSVQVFNNLISFSAVHQNPRVAEEIIEAFEDFIQEHMSTFHENGISNIFYDRRYPDGRDARIGQDLSVRKIGYLLILEKVTLVSYSRIQEITIDVRTFRTQYYDVPPATPNFDVSINDNLWDQGE